MGGIGHTHFDLWAAGQRPQNFYMLGTMGLAAPIALGVALAQPQRRVFALEGDGSLLMQLGTLGGGAMGAPALGLLGGLAGLEAEAGGDEKGFGLGGGVQEFGAAQTRIEDGHAGRPVFALINDLLDNARIESGRLELASGQVLERVTRPLFSAGRAQGRVWSFRDLSERLAADQQLETLARTDDLIDALARQAEPVRPSRGGRALGLMLAIAVPVALAMSLAGAFALFHGHAHGTELPRHNEQLAEAARTAQRRRRPPQ